MRTRVRVWRLCRILESRLSNVSFPHIPCLSPFSLVRFRVCLCFHFLCLVFFRLRCVLSLSFLLFNPLVIKVYPQVPNANPINAQTLVCQLAIVVRRANATRVAEINLTSQLQRVENPLCRGGSLRLKYKKIVRTWTGRAGEKSAHTHKIVFPLSYCTLKFKDRLH